MTHEEALNLLLSNHCVQKAEGNIRTFEIDLHYRVATVVAEIVKWSVEEDDKPFEYKILSVEIK